MRKAWSALYDGGISFEDLLEAKQWALDTQKGHHNLEKWELGKIALKLKPEIEAKARANQSAAGGDKSDKGALLTTLSEALPSVSTRKVSWAIHPILYLNSTP